MAFTSAIDSCARAGDWLNAERVLGQMIFEDKVVPNLRTYRAACKAAAAAGEFEKCEELLDDVRDSVSVSERFRTSRSRRWRRRDATPPRESLRVS